MSSKKPLASSVAKAYDTWAERYDSQPNLTRDLDACLLRDLLPELTDRRVLELGCGSGKNTPGLLSARHVVALDFSSGMLAKAKQRLARISSPTCRVQWVAHDLTQPLPFEDRSFDLVTFDLVLEHLEDLEAVFREVSRVLTPGGRVVMIEYHPYRQLPGEGRPVPRSGLGRVGSDREPLPLPLSVSGGDPGGGP
jgi:ubiquinone/menaquinone biosynthesis C-methylase UbiE